jgi:TonB family protein
MSFLNNSHAALILLVACSVKETVLLIAAWIITLFLRNRSAAVRHYVWAAVILSALALPLFTFLLPTWHSAVLGGAAAALWSPVTSAAPRSGSESLPAMIVNASTALPFLGRLLDRLANIILLVWLVGVLVFLVRFAVGLARLAWASRRAKPLPESQRLLFLTEISRSLSIARPIKILQCAHPLVMPLTWGIFCPLVILPSSASEWSENRMRMVLFHEFTHIVRHDWCLRICAEVARSIHWFHPLVGIAARRLRHESERACDDSVLNSGVEPSEYANLLLDLARTLENSARSWSVALCIARPTTLERRFTAMLNPSIKRTQVSRRTGLFTAFFALCLLLPLAALRLPAQNVSGTFAGTIQDPSGSGVKNATVILNNHKANTVVMTASDENGNYSFKSLPAGEYEMKVVKRGFEPYRTQPVTLEPGRDLSRNLTLEVAAVMEEVDVVPAGTSKPLPEAGGKPSRMRLGGEIQATKLLNKVMPVYPDVARTAGTQGTVILHAVIGIDGKPLSLRVMNSQADPDLARSAVESVSQWRYRPTLLNGEPIEVDTTIMVNFSLAP